MVDGGGVAESTRDEHADEGDSDDDVVIASSSVVLLGVFATTRSSDDEDIVFSSFGAFGISGSDFNLFVLVLKISSNINSFRIKGGQIAQIIPKFVDV